MKVLVTGSSGFLGGWLAKRLIEKSYSVRVLCRPKSDLSFLDGLDFEKAFGDVTDLESVQNAVQGVDGVFHVAALIGYAPSQRDEMFRVNVGGTENIVKACVKHKVKRLVHTSSIVAVGARFKPEILDETSSFGLESFHLGYHDSKRASEKVVLEASGGGNIEGVVVNPSIIFGPGDFLKATRKTHLKVAQGKIGFYPPGGCNVTHVDDVVDAHLSAFLRGKSGERYILGGENITLKKLFAYLAEAGGHRAPKIPVPAVALRSAFELGRNCAKLGMAVNWSSESMLNGTLYHWYDSKKAQRDLGAKFRSAKEAIGASMDWCRQNGML